MNESTKSNRQPLMCALTAAVIIVVFLYPMQQVPNLSEGKNSNISPVSNVKNSIQTFIDYQINGSETPDKMFREKASGFLGAVKNFVVKENPKQKQSGFASTGKLFKGEKIRKFPLADLKFNGGRPKPFLRPLPPRPWCTKWAVVTTIFEMSESVMRQAKTHEWCTVIVSDKKTPRNYRYSLPLDSNSAVTVLLRLEDQAMMKHEFIDLIPWNNFGRKNIGYLYAIEHGAQIIWDFDDDNLLKFWIKGAAPKTFPSLTLSESTEVTVNTIRNFTENALNPIYSLGGPKNLWTRGFPLRKIRNPQTYNFTEKLHRKTIKTDELAVLQSVADIQPDLDAIGRLVAADIPVWFQRKIETSPLVIPKGAYVSYNAQATMHFYKGFAGLLLPITVTGRVSDIWRAYFSQNLFQQYDLKVGYYSRPMVVQNRNQHNMLADFQAEEHLYQRSEVLINFLANWTSSSNDFCTKMEQLWVALYERGYIEIADVKMMQAWLKALANIGYKFPGDPEHITPAKQFAKPYFYPLQSDYQWLENKLEMKNGVECKNLPKKHFYVTNPTDLAEIIKSTLENAGQTVTVLQKPALNQSGDPTNSTSGSYAAKNISVYDDTIRSDALICSSGCDHLLQKNKTLILAFSHKKCLYNDWNTTAKLANSTNSTKYVYVAANNFDSRIFEHFTNLIPFVGFAHRTPVQFGGKQEMRSKILVFGDYSHMTFDAIAKDIVPGEQMLEQRNFSEIQSHMAAIFIPSSVNSKYFQILYSLSVPLFVPYMNSSVANRAVVASRSCETSSSQGHRKSIHPYGPFALKNDTEAQRYWLQFSDYYSFPHITYFANERDVEEKFASTKLTYVRQLMQLENTMRRLKLDNLWCTIVKKIS